MNKKQVIFRSAPVSHKRGYYFEDQGLVFLNLMCLICGTLLYAMFTLILLTFILLHRSKEQDLLLPNSLKLGFHLNISCSFRRVIARLQNARPFLLLLVIAFLIHHLPFACCFLQFLAICSSIWLFGACFCMALMLLILVPNER